MNSRLLSVLIIFPIWLILILVFRRHRQWLLYYLVAAFGCTLQLVFLAEYFGFDQISVNIASFHVNLISKNIFHIPMELMSNGRFQLMLTNGGSSILKLGIECSAILESSILIGLLLFYPLFSLRQRCLRVIFGLVVTYVINIFRLMIIVLMAYKFGPDYIFLAHAGVARIFFFLAELMLYWYLITKPTVKSVGVAIKDGITLKEAAQIGKSLQFKHAIAQLSVILIIIQISILTFGFSSDWHKAFVRSIPQNRPLIYQDETTLTPVTDAETSLNQEVFFGLTGNEKKILTFKIFREEELIVRVLKGEYDIAARLGLNDQSEEFVTVPSWLFDKTDSIFNLFKVKPGDTLEIKIQNLAEKPSDYAIKIASADESNIQICKIESSTKEGSINPTPTPTPAPSAMSNIQGASSGKFDREIPLSLEGGRKILLRFDITQKEILNIQVPQGDEDLATRVIINGDEFGFITSTPWRYTKQKSIFEPISVKPGDVLEIRFQNLADDPSNYLVRIFQTEEKDEQ